MQTQWSAPNLASSRVAVASMKSVSCGWPWILLWLKRRATTRSALLASNLAEHGLPALYVSSDGRASTFRHPDYSHVDAGRDRGGMASRSDGVAGLIPAICRGSFVANGIKVVSAQRNMDRLPLRDVDGRIATARSRNSMLLRPDEGINLNRTSMRLRNEALCSTTAGEDASLLGRGRARGGGPARRSDVSATEVASRLIEPRLPDT